MMDFHDLADAFDAAAAGLRDAVCDVADAVADEALQLAVGHSQGTESLAEMQRADHPHARRHGGRRRDAVIINAQSQRFLRAWEAEPVQVQGDEVSAAAINTAPHAKFLHSKDSRYPDGGTDTMFGRDLPGAVEAELAGTVEPRLEAAVERLLTP